MLSIYLFHHLVITLRSSLTLPQVLLCFFRDTEVLSHFEHSSASPPLAVARGNTPSPNALVAYPPCGVIPFHGFTMYGTSPLHETLDLFLSLFSSLETSSCMECNFLEFGIPYLGSYSRHLLIIIHYVQCIRFKTYCYGTFELYSPTDSLCTVRRLSIQFGTAFRHTRVIPFSQVHRVRHAALGLRFGVLSLRSYSRYPFLGSITYGASPV